MNRRIALALILVVALLALSLWLAFLSMTSIEIAESRSFTSIANASGTYFEPLLVLRIMGCSRQLNLTAVVIRGEVSDLRLVLNGNLSVYLRDEGGGRYAVTGIEDLSHLLHLSYTCVKPVCEVEVYVECIVVRHPYSLLALPALILNVASLTALSYLLLVVLALRRRSGRITL